MDPLYQVTHGRLTPDELAALTVVLMARAGGAAPAGSRRHRPGPRWRRLGPAGGYLSPVSWR